MSPGADVHKLKRHQMLTIWSQCATYGCFYPIPEYWQRWVSWCRSRSILLMTVDSHIHIPNLTFKHKICWDANFSSVFSHTWLQGKRINLKCVVILLSIWCLFATGFLETSQMVDYIWNSSIDQMGAWDTTVEMVLLSPMAGAIVYSININQCNYHVFYPCLIGFAAGTD